jgi:hypothetical protein
MRNYYREIIKKYPTTEIIIFLILAAGVLLSLAQFLYNRSLWADEVSLALNIIHKDSFDLLKPLDYVQVAPVLFLYAEKLFSTLLPNTEYGLRLFPLLCFWGAIFFFYKIIKKQQYNTAYALVFALSLFAFNPKFIYFSSEVKQYMTDVFVLLALFYFVLKNYKTEQNKYYALGIVGGIAIFLSNVSPIILATCGLYLLYDQFFVKKSRKNVPLFAVFAVWLFIFSLYYIFFIYNHPTREVMVEYWANMGAFLSYHNFISFFIDKIGVMLYLLSCCWTAPPPHPLIALVLGAFGIVTTAGVITLIRQKNIKTIILTFSPIVLHLLLSVFQLYPFDMRLILYTVPCLIIICALGFESIFRFVFTKLKIANFTPLVVIIPCVFLLAGHPIKIEREEIKKSIQYIQENIDEKESLYLYSYSVATFNYYEEIGFVKMNVPTIEGTNKLIEKKYVDEFRAVRGKNWLLFSHIAHKEDALVVNYLDSIGCTKLNEFKTVGSSAYLYDFGE